MNCYEVVFSLPKAAIYQQSAQPYHYDPLHVLWASPTLH